MDPLEVIFKTSASRDKGLGVGHSTTIIIFTFIFQTQLKISFISYTSSQAVLDTAHVTNFVQSHPITAQQRSLNLSSSLGVLPLQSIPLNLRSTLHVHPLVGVN